MWLTPTDLIRINHSSEIIGRATLVCQKFETTCNEILSWFEATRVLINKEYEFMSDEYKSYVDRLHSYLLNKSINELTQKKNGFRPSEKELKILNDARKSRNWIVHESGISSLYNYRTNNETLTKEQLQIHVKNVARGEFLVSKWSYEFYERKSHNLVKEEIYVNLILDWVIEPPNENEIRTTLWFFN
ncbi:hypothetical protein J7E71_18410 [Mesobacillus foraminis]|uniref:hypothetical protein n=1 Tax=Mesobacillus foraminis TaxID=279826 RepID=UPI001BE902BE|nr:hypothetical protein [Mesobacillus foraminis]MBT2757862.1 hypothetical protein [Mesobacillus foraminis]